MKYYSIKVHAYTGEVSVAKSYSFHQALIGKWSGTPVFDHKFRPMWAEESDPIFENLYSVTLKHRLEFERGERALNALNWDNIRVELRTHGAMVVLCNETRAIAPWVVQEISIGWVSRMAIGTLEQLKSDFPKIDYSLAEGMRESGIYSTHATRNKLWREDNKIYAGSIEEIRQAVEKHPLVISNRTHYLNSL